MDDPIDADRRSAPAFEHVRVPGSDEGAPVLVLLHGSNGDEHDLLAPAATILPGAARLALRGGVAMEHGHTFFQRFADRRIDEADLASRVPGLLRFLEQATARSGVRTEPLLIGYSSGAIMATALVLVAPERFSGAILLRPARPFADAPPWTLRHLPVLVVDGEGDPRRAPDDGVRTAELLRRAGARVQHRTSAAGHPIGEDDLRIARRWVSRAGLGGAPSGSV